MRLLLPLLSGLLLTSCGDPGPPLPGDMVEVRVEGMHCEGCEIRVEKALSGIPGVKAVWVHHGMPRVLVRIKDASNREALLPEIQKAAAAVQKQIRGE